MLQMPKCTNAKYATNATHAQMHKHANASNVQPLKCTNTQVLQKNAQTTPVHCIGWVWQNQNPQAHTVFMPILRVEELNMRKQLELK